MEKLSEKITRARSSRDIPPPQKKYRNRFYTKEFEGYAETVQVEPDGKKRIIRTYTGEYYQRSLTEQRSKRYRVLYAALYLLAVALFVAGGTRAERSNLAWYVALPVAAALPPVFMTLPSLITYLFAGDRLKIPEYKKGAVRLRRTTLISSLCLSLAALCSALFICLHSADFTVGGLICMMLYLGSAAALFAVNRMESQVRYEVVENAVQKVGS